METVSGARLLHSTGSLYTHDLAYNFEVAADVGFDGIELMAGAAYATRDPRYIGQLMARYGLPVDVVHAPFRSNAPGWDSGGFVRLYEQAVELAQAIEARAVVVHVPSRIGYAVLHLGTKTLVLPWWPNPQQEVVTWMKSGAMQDLEARTGITIAVENLPLRSFFGRRVNAFHWNTLEEWPAAHQHLTLDTTHWGTHDINPVKAYEAGGSKVRHIHLSNIYKTGYLEHRLPHDGDMDLAHFLNTLTVNGYDHTITLELVPDSLEHTDDHAVRRNLTVSLRYCRKHLGQPEATTG